MSIYYYQLTGNQEEVLERLRLHNVDDKLWYEFDEETLKIWFGDKYRCKREMQFQMEFVTLNEKEYLKLEPLTWMKGVGSRGWAMDSFWKMKVGAIPQKTIPFPEMQKVTYSYVEGVPRRKKNIFQKTTVRVMVLFLLIIQIIIPIRYSTKYECMQESEYVKSINIYAMNEGSVETIEDEMMIYKTVKSSEYEGFINGLEGLSFENEIWLLPIPTDPNFSYDGLVVKIVYNDGSYEMISPYGIQTQVNAKGKSKYTHYSCDDAAWFRYLSQYSFSKQN